jgi:outer membrane lipoprotein-sorting protein
MRRNLKRVLVIVIMGLLGPTGAPAQTNRTISLDQVRAALAPVRSVAAAFVQERHLALFNEPLRSEGYLCFQKPGCIRWETTKPYESILVADGSGVAQFEHADGHWKKLELGLGSALQNIISQIAGVMAGSYASGQGDYSVTVTNDASGPAITLVPRNETIRRMMAAIEVHLTADLLATRQVVLRETDGDFTVITFSGQAANIALPPKTFDLAAPADLALIQAAAQTRPASP